LLQLLRSCASKCRTWNHYTLFAGNLAKISFPAHLRQGHHEAARQVHSLFAFHIFKDHGFGHMREATLHFVRGNDAEAFSAGTAFQKTIPMLFP
jgi:hypothetical protein